MPRSRRHWHSIATAKVAADMKKIPQDWILDELILCEAKSLKKITGTFIENLLDPATRRITDLDTPDLLTAIRNSDLSARQVVTAFCKRAAYGHQLNKNLLEINFYDAIEQAKFLDEYFANHRKVVGPLHGLPFTMKDQWHVKGLDTTMGYVGWINTFEGLRGTGKERVFESQLVTEFRNLGAIPIGKSSMMQTIWWGETENNILGYNYNPQHQGLSSGGSSGGEASIQALRGSAIGVASDIGGSVTMPAAYTGVYGFKPSHGRITLKGVANSSPGQMVIPTQAGLIGNSIASIKTVLNALVSNEPWKRDAELLPIPYRHDWDEDISRGKRRTFGIMLTDGHVKPHPPIVRAIRMVERALKAAGHKTIPWDPPSHSEATILHTWFTNADGRPDVLENLALSDEPPMPGINVQHEPRARGSNPIREYYDMTRRLQKYRDKYAAYWQSTTGPSGNGRAVDAVIQPCGVASAMIRGRSYYYAYSSVSNVLDHSIAVIPVTTADASVDVFEQDYKPLNDVDKAVWEAYDEQRYDGAPASVQIVCQKLEEEKVLAMAGLIDNAVKDYKRANRS